MHGLGLVLALQIRPPSYSSIRYWEQKMSYYRLSTVSADSGQEWVLIIDESIAIGREKLLLFLGVDLGAYCFGQPLCFADVHDNLHVMWYRAIIDVHDQLQAISGLDILQRRYCPVSSATIVITGLDLLHHRVNCHVCAV